MPSYDSFIYNGVDMLREFGLMIIAYDLLTPRLRPRKIEVPLRSGAYDLGAYYHDERDLYMECRVERALTNAQLDSLKYVLSRKGRIVLWDKPDRYYFGRSYDAPQIIDSHAHAIREFDLTFTCDPYAQALEPTIRTITQADGGQMWFSAESDKYGGTRRVPTRITITNNASTPMQAIRISTREGAS